ncbi:unnamed protein product [Gulo gulo]|uniref:Uncharacterized protein n=1 Tax=Gulo gulo TaxID=48420 RepID=A0A9X9LI40_GULGU|nr:unnamed protein product [Gulo gulo]
MGTRRGFSHQGLVKPAPPKKSGSQASHEHPGIPAGTPPSFVPQEGALYPNLPKVHYWEQRDHLGIWGQELGDRSDNKAFLADRLHPSRKWPRREGAGASGRT